MAPICSIAVLNGPNLNMLGMREPDIYGRQTLADIEAECRRLASEKRVEIDWYQSNLEGELITKIQSLTGSVDWVVINAAGLTHTSIALRDALSLFSYQTSMHAKHSDTHHLFPRLQRALLSGLAQHPILWRSTPLRIYIWRLSSNGSFTKNRFCAF
jgi:3-dehydroquinate dehydratase-2